MTTPASPPRPEAAPDETALEHYRAEELAWATSRFPEIATYRSAREIDAMKAALLSWAERGKSVTVFDQACRPALVTRYDDELLGNLSREITRNGGNIRESYDQISIGVRMNEFGCNSVEYERDAERKWTVISSQGLGCARTIGLSISKVSEDAVWYDAALIRLSIDCSAWVVEETPCADGKAKVCRRCEDWAVRPHSLESTFGIGRQPSTRRVKLPPADRCDSACAADSPPLDVKRANEALRWHEFLHTLDLQTDPVVFRTKAACRAYRKMRYVAEAAELWHAGKPRPPDLPPPSLPEE